MPFTYSIIGTAFDYRFKCFFKKLNAYRTSGFMGARLLSRNEVWLNKEAKITNQKDVSKFEESGCGILIDAFFEEFEKWLYKKRLKGKQLGKKEEYTFGKYLCILTLFDQYGASGISNRQNSALLRLKSHSLNELLLIPEKIWLDDLFELTTALYKQHKSLFKLPDRTPFLVHPRTRGFLY